MIEGKSIFEYCGYFDDPEQTLPVYHMGEAQLCPVCNEPVGYLHKSVQVLPLEPVTRSYFFYLHDECCENTAAIDEFSGLLVDTDASFLPPGAVAQ